MDKGVTPCVALHHVDGLAEYEVIFIFCQTQNKFPRPKQKRYVSLLH